jgi:hypothetical protein
VVLDRVVADADTEAQPAARQQVDVGRLPGDQDRLALWQDQDPGDEFDPPSDRRQVAEGDQRVMERVLLVVRTLRHRRLTLNPVDAAHDVVVEQHVVVAQFLGGHREPMQCLGISAQLVLWEGDAEPHKGRHRCSLPRLPGFRGSHNEQARALYDLSEGRVHRERRLC